MGYRGEFDQRRSSADMSRNPKELIGRGTKILYVRPSLGTFGGAELSDIQHLSVFRRLGAEIDILTGVVSDPLKLEAERRGLTLLVDSRLDKSTSPSTDAIYNAVDAHLTDHRLLLVSPSVSLPPFIEAISPLTRQRRSAVRVHDNWRDRTIFSQVDPAGLGLPTQELIGRDMHEANPHMKIMVLPPYIDYDMFANATHEDGRAVRERHGIADDDFVILQPTQITKYKGIPRALDLAIKLDRALRGEKRVHLLVEGGREPVRKTTQVIDELKHQAKEAGFTNLVFTGAILPHDNLHPGSYYQAADVITNMSNGETYGMGRAESALAGKPCLTTNYRSVIGDQPVFQTVYLDQGFRFIVEQDPFGTGISNEVFNQVLAIARDPRGWDQNRSINRMLAEQIYGREHTEDLIANILRWSSS